MDGGSQYRTGDSSQNYSTGKEMQEDKVVACGDLTNSLEKR